MGGTLSEIAQCVLNSSSCLHAGARRTKVVRSVIVYPKMVLEPFKVARHAGKAKFVFVGPRPFLRAKGCEVGSKLLAQVCPGHVRLKILRVGTYEEIPVQRPVRACQVVSAPRVDCDHAAIRGLVCVHLIPIQRYRDDDFGISVHARRSWPCTDMPPQISSSSFIICKEVKPEIILTHLPQLGRKLLWQNAWKISFSNLS